MGIEVWARPGFQQMVPWLVVLVREAGLYSSASQKVPGGEKLLGW